MNHKRSQIHVNDLDTPEACAFGVSVACGHTLTHDLHIVGTPKPHMCHAITTPIHTSTHPLTTCGLCELTNRCNQHVTQSKLHGPHVSSTANLSYTRPSLAANTYNYVLLVCLWCVSSQQLTTCTSLAHHGHECVTNMTLLKHANTHSYTSVLTCCHV